MQEPLVYRILPPAEWDRLEPIRARRSPDEPMPVDPITSSCVVAELEGQIVAVLFLQMALHLEPLIIHPEGRRHGVNFLRLVKEIEDNLPEGSPYYVFSPNRKIDTMVSK